MGRKKANDTVSDEKLMEIFDVWYANEGYPDKINWAGFARAVQAADFNISRTSLMRRSELKKYIDEQMNLPSLDSICGSGYQTIDINSIMDNASDDKIIEAFHALDKKLKVTTRTIELLRAKLENKDKENSEQEQEIKALKEKLDKKSARVSELLEIENDYRVLKTRLKEQDKSDMEDFYDELENTGVVPDKAVFVTANLDPEEAEAEVRKSRLSVVSNRFK